MAVKIISNSPCKLKVISTNKLIAKIIPKLIPSIKRWDMKDLSFEMFLKLDLICLVISRVVKKVRTIIAAPNSSPNVIWNTKLIK